MMHYLHVNIGYYLVNLFCLSLRPTTNNHALFDYLFRAMVPIRISRICSQFKVTDSDYDWLDSQQRFSVVTSRTFVCWHS